MTRQPTPDVLGHVLGPVDDTRLIRAELRYDYSLIPAEQRDAVQAAAVDIVRAGRRAQEDLLKIGQLLIDVKDRLEHGQFQEWCSTEFDMSQRTAQRMMQVASVFGGKSDTVSLLSDSAMYLLAAPSTPEEARVEVIEQAQATGKSPTKAEVVETIRKHQPAPAQTYLEVWKLEAQASTLAKEWDMDPAMMREAARQQLGSYWGELTHRVNQVGGYRVSDLKQAINNVASRMEAKQPQQPAGKPMMEVLKTDAEREHDALAADIASRNAAADEAERQAAVAARAEAARQAVLTPGREQRAVAKADAAFGLAQPRTRNERIDALMHVFQGAVDALPELGELTGQYTAGTALLRELNKALQILKDNRIGGYKANE